MNVFNFILAALVIAGLIVEVSAPEDSKRGKIGIGVFAIGALLLAASVFVDGIGFIIWGV